MGSLIKTIIFCFLASLYGRMALSYVFAAHLLVNKSTKQRIVLLSDYHEDTKASIAQRISILDAAKGLDAYLLVEDNCYRCDYADPDEVIAYPSCFQPLLDDLVADPVHFDANKQYDGDFSVLDPTADNETTPLLLLTPMARNKGIKTKTVECRQAEKISYRNGPISACQVCKAYEAIVSRIAQYDDGDKLNAFYEQKLKVYHTRHSWCPNFFKYLEGNSNNLNQAFNETAYESEVWNAYKRVEFDNYVNDYMAQGAQLAEARQLASKIPIKLEEGRNLYASFFMYLYNFVIDSTIIHEVATHIDEPIIIIYCGSWHARSVLPVLQGSGFEVEKAWDASKNPGQSALNLDCCFAQVQEQLQESIDAKKETVIKPVPLLNAFNSDNFSFLDLIIDTEGFNHGLLPFGLPFIIV